MNIRSKATLLVAVMAMAGVGSAGAQDFGRRDNGPGNATGYSRATGGFCDSRGCPNLFWTYKIYYGPVYYRGTWFRGPVYVKDDRGRHYFWVAGGWHRDEWHAERPRWARNAGFGPALSRNYYEGREFRDRDERRADNYGRGDQRDYSGDNRGYSENQNRDQGGDRSGRSYDGQQNRRYGGDQQNDSFAQGTRDNYRQQDGRQVIPQSGGGYYQGQQNRGDYRPDNAIQPGSSNRYGGSDQNARDGNPSSNPTGVFQGQPAGQNYRRNGQSDGLSQSPTVISVTSATYGASCKAPKGNVTKFLQTACDGKSSCQYSVDYKTIGDPAPGCSKDFSVEWTCGGIAGGTSSAAGEAGLGSKVTLACTSGR
jgi:hypothetical protein